MMDYCRPPLDLTENDHSGTVSTFITQVSVTMTLAPGAPEANLSILLNSVLMLVATAPHPAHWGPVWTCRALLIGWLDQRQRDQ